MDTEKGGKTSAPRVIVHVDMDAFFAAVEQLDHPEYKGRPVVVGADPMSGKGRGVVSAASYEARRFGIHSAMPISRAYRLCPGAVYVRPRMGRYSEISGRVMEVLNEFSPLIEQISIDEAFLDCTGTEKINGPPENIGRSIKKRIYEETSLTSSVGVAAVKSVAKIASELCKPDGLLICPPGGEREFLSPLPLKHLWGAGKVTIEKLNSLGFRVVGDIQSASREHLAELFGEQGRALWDLANGIDERQVIADYERKSIGEERTFPRDVSADSTVEKVLFRLADDLTRNMRMEGIRGKTITLKLRLEGFETFTRSRTLKEAVQDTKTVRDNAVELYRRFDRGGKKVRLVGISVSNLGKGVQADTEQLELFSEREGSHEGELSCGHGEALVHGKFLQKGQPAERGKLPAEGRVKGIPDELLDNMKLHYGSKITRAAFLPSKSRRTRSGGEG